MDEILKRIPHRPPFLFVDRIIELEGQTIKTQKDVLPTEPYFEGHYPDRPIMPGVLICEAIFQSGAILVAHLKGDVGGGVPMVTRINNVKFRVPVLPGDLLDMEVTLKETVANAFYLTGKGSVGGKTVVTVEFTAMLVEDEA